jgi:hypothetical protein
MSTLLLVGCSSSHQVPSSAASSGSTCTRCASKRWERCGGRGRRRSDITTRKRRTAPLGCSASRFLCDLARHTRTTTCPQFKQGTTCDEPNEVEAYSGASCQAAQTDYPARPQPKNRPEAYPQGRTVRRIRSTTSVRAAELVRRPGPVEDLFEVRTQLEVCFSSRS